MGRLLGFVALLIVALVGWRVYLFLDAAGEFRPAPAPKGECIVASTVDGLQDIALDQFSIYVSRRSTGDGAGHESLRGTLSLYWPPRGRDEFPDYYTESSAGDSLTSQTKNSWSSSAPGDSARDAASQPAQSQPGITQEIADLTDAKALPAFTPGSLSVHRNADKTRQIAVINHAGGESVEIFDVERGAYVWCEEDKPRLIHRRTVKSPLFRNLNSIALVGPDQFYVTNDHHFASRILQRVEEFLMLPSANVVYFDGSSARVVASRLTYATGVALSWDEKHVHVAETTPHLLLTYDRDPTSGSLTLAPAPMGRFDTGTNVTKVAADYGIGGVALAAHPKLLAFLDVFGDHRPSPSEVQWLSWRSNAWHKFVLFDDDGSRIRSLDALGQLGGTIVGSTSGKAMLACALESDKTAPPPPPPPELEPPYEAPKSCQPPDVQVEVWHPPHK
jgi:arylesterase / paraoxonase